MTDKKHEMVSDLKRVAEELGHTPTFLEYLKIGNFSKHQVALEFGGFTVFVTAAGMQKSGKPNKFQIPEMHSPEQIQEAIELTRERRVIKLNDYKKIIVLGDVHFPFQHGKALAHAMQIIEKEKPDIVVQIGDLYDQYSASKFPRSLNLYTPKAEFELAREGGIKMWADVHAAAPKAECFQLTGNHDVRAAKRIMEAWPAGEHLIEPVMRQLFTFDGVKTIYDPTEELQIGSILFIHGYLGQLGAHRDYNQSNVVCGHTHRGSVAYRAIAEKTLWELNVGLLGDPYSKALSYRPQKIHNWTLGIGIIDSYGPRFVSF